MGCCKCNQGYATLCRVFTYGWLITSVVLSLFAVASCEFVTRNDLTIGLYRFSRDGGECMEYSDINGYETGWLHDWARVSGVLAPLLGILAIVLMAVDCCCDICCSKYMQTGLIVCCQINQGMTFLIWVSDSCFTRKGSDNSTTLINRGCRIGDGSILSFSAFILFVVSGFFLCCNPKPDPLCNKRDEDENEGKKCCGRGGKEKKSGDAKESDENKPAVQEEKDKDPAVAAAVVTEKEKDAEDTNTPENEKDVEEAKENTDQKPVASGETSHDEEAQNDKVDTVDEVTQTEGQEEAQDEEAPDVVPVPVPAMSVTPPPGDLSMEVELDEEFGTSQVRY